MRTTLVIIAVLALLVIAGCAPKAAMPGPGMPTATDKAVSDVGSEVSDLGTLADDLDTAELNALDQELADIESLELQ
jgi:hypothetical protein